MYDALCWKLVNTFADLLDLVFLFLIWTFWVIWVWPYLARPNIHIWHIWQYLARQIYSIGVSLKRYCKMQFSRVDLRSIGPSSQKLWPNLILDRFPYCNYYGGFGGPVLREGGILGKNAFSDISFSRPQAGPRINFGQYEFPKFVFCETV